MRAVVRDAYYVVIIISNLIDIKLLEIYRINSKVILQTENQNHLFSEKMGDFQG